MEAADMAMRYKIKFPTFESYQAGSAVEIGDLGVRVRNDKRHFISIEIDPQRVSLGPGAEPKMRILEKEYGAKIVEDFQYDLETHLFMPEMQGPDEPTYPSLDDVVSMIRAKDAWQLRGQNRVVLAVVDTGVNGLMVPAARRIGSWQPIGDEDAWKDYWGHGTMCACIAAGTADLATFDGVAPNIGIISCRTKFYDSELSAIYDFLTELKGKLNVPIVATNSFGVNTGSPTDDSPDSDFIPSLNEAVAAGIIVCFSAGNYHELAGGKPEECNPTSIWLYKCLSNLLTVATCKLDRTMWSYSSRGPGQKFGQPGCSRKPDVTAPTPVNGRVVYGDKVVSMADGWGTSGACPQVAALAVLMLEINPHLTRDELFNIIRSTADPLGLRPECEGSGLINCLKAVKAVRNKTSQGREDAL
jgi:serine protease AprX